MKKNKKKIVCLQTTSSKDPQKNINMLEELFAKISSKADLICLPECVAVFTDKRKEINFFLEKYRESFFNLISYQAKKKKKFNFSRFSSRKIQ